MYLPSYYNSEEISLCKCNSFWYHENEMNYLPMILILPKFDLSLVILAGDIEPFSDSSFIVIIGCSVYFDIYIETTSRFWRFD